MVIARSLKQKIPHLRKKKMSKYLSWYLYVEVFFLISTYYGLEPSVRGKYQEAFDYYRYVCFLRHKFKQIRLKEKWLKSEPSIFLQTIYHISHWNQVEHVFVLWIAVVNLLFLIHYPLPTFVVCSFANQFNFLLSKHFHRLSVQENLAAMINSFLFWNIFWLILLI